MFSRPVPPSAPASQNHAFGHENGRKRARKDGPAGGHYGFAFCIDVARQHYWDRYMPNKARGDTLLLGATFKAADQDTKYLFTKLYLEVPMKEVNEDGSFSLKVEDVYLFSRTSPLEEKERVRVPLAEASILFEQSDFEACAFSGTLRLKGTLPNEEKESFEINPVYFTMSDKWDSYVINYLFWGPEHMGFRGKHRCSNMLIFGRCVIMTGRGGRSGRCGSPTWGLATRRRIGTMHSAEK